MKEPALSDGRLQPGDKLLAANGVELASFSHQEVIIMIIMMMMMMMGTIVKIIMMMMMRYKLLAAFLSSRGDYHDGDHEGDTGWHCTP